MKKIPFIAVEGVIGVGKTSLAERLASHFGYNLLKEIVDENPFLSKFYDDIDEWSFQTEMFFLCNRYKQLGDIRDKFIANDKPIVADYHIFKNRIFAKLTLPEFEYNKYEKMYHTLVDDMPTPNMIIFLDANLPTLEKRIAMRARSFEQSIDPAYLQNLVDDYRAFIKAFERTHPDVPIIRLNADDLDFVHSTDDWNEVLKTIENTFYLPTR